MPAAPEKKINNMARHKVFMNPQTGIEIWLHYTSELHTRKFNMNVSSCTEPRKSNLTFLF